MVCGFHAASSDNMGGKGIDDMVCGFHTMSSDNMGEKELENRRRGVGDGRSAGHDTKDRGKDGLWLRMATETPIYRSHVQNLI